MTRYVVHVFGHQGCGQKFVALAWEGLHTAESAIPQKRFRAIVPRIYNLSKSQKPLQRDLQNSGEAVIHNQKVFGKT